jgi:hypothetical protein
VFQDATAFLGHAQSHHSNSCDGSHRPSSKHSGVDCIYDAPIRAALAMGKKTLNRYYTLTDASEVYRIAMSAFLIDLLSHIYCNSFGSITSLPQTHILCKGWLGACMDRLHKRSFESNLTGLMLINPLKE